MPAIHPWGSISARERGPYHNDKDLGDPARLYVSRRFPTRDPHPQMESNMTKAASKKRSKSGISPQTIYRIERFFLLHGTMPPRLEPYSPPEPILERLLAAQEGRCAICFNTLGRRQAYTLDHCHVCSEWRGLLCRRCNSALGGIEQFGSVLLQRAIDYLHSSPTGMCTGHSLTVSGKSALPEFSAQHVNSG
jgi:hypothetical protein